mgnify:FL=1
MKCTDDEYRFRCTDTKNIDIHELIIKDKEDYFEELKKFSCLRVLLASLLKFVEYKDDENCKYVSIEDSLEIVISFLKSNYEGMYHRFMGVLSNKQVHFVSYNDIPEILSVILDYIYSIAKEIDISITSCEVLDKISDIIYHDIYNSELCSYLVFLNLDINEIVMNCATTDDYEFLKECYIDSIMKFDVSSYAAEDGIFICYNNTIKDAFNILHEFIHLDNLCPDNVVHYDENIYFGDFTSNRPHNFFLNEIPSIMMEGELYDFLANNYNYNLSFYLSYRLGLMEKEIKGLFLPIMNISSDNKVEIDDEYIEFVRFLLNSSENFSLMYMFMYEYDNYDNRHLSYILGIIISMYAMTLDKSDRVNIFNYIRSKITSDEDYFTMFKNIGLDLFNGEDLSKLVCSLYDRDKVMKNGLVKKR